MISSTTHEGRITIVEVFPADDSTTAGLIGKGETRCRPEDAYSPLIGEIIALGRAVQDLGRKCEEIGLARTVTNEEVERVLGHFATLFLGGN